jgi:dolichol-phosphate mannosyltransferase
MPHAAPTTTQSPVHVAQSAPPSLALAAATVGPILSVIIPCYNEQRTILTIIERVQAVAIAKEIIVVDDGSTDGTRELLAALVADLPGITVLFHEGNRGKGASVATGLARAIGRVVIIQDADLEYDPQEYGAVIAPILAGEAQVVYGSRNLQPNHYSYRFFYWGGRLVTLVTNLLYGSRLTDEATCYKAFVLPVIQGLHLTSLGFEFCPEVTAKVLRQGYAIREVPISYHARPREEGKKIRASDGLRAIWTLLKYRVAPAAAPAPARAAARTVELPREVRA